MSRKRVFVLPGAIRENRVEVRGDEYHHMARVRHVRPGTAVEVFDGEGRGWQGRVALVERDRLTIHLEAPLEPSGREPVLDVRLCQGLPATRGTMGEIVARATELGAGRITPVITARSRAALLRNTGGLARRRPRWERIARDACKSSGRFRPPAIDDPAAFEDLLRQVAGGGGMRLIPAEHGAHPSIPAALATGTAAGPVTLLVGPEGGWTGDELEMALGAGFSPVSLGPRILRTATAALAALAAVQIAAGDMK